MLANRLFPPVQEENLAYPAKSSRFHAVILRLACDLHIQNRLRIVAGLSEECMVAYPQARNLLRH